MKKIYLIHGFNGYPNGGWRPWLMRELYKAKTFAVALEMPKPKAPIKDEWVAKIKEEVGEVVPDKYLVGHSLGVPAILRFLETLNEGEKIAGAFLVSGPVDNVNIKEISNFFETPFNFEHIKKVCDKFYIIHGDADSVVPFSNAEKLSKELNAPIIKVVGADHLGDSDGVYELPQLLEIILTEVR